MFAFAELYGTALDGKYRIGRLLGQGGMGAVFAAEHLGTGRTVAVKVILPQLLRYSEALERFRREARAAGRLRHPNIVDVTDFGVATVGENEIAYLVMEHLEGTTLRAFMDERGRVEPEVVVPIVEQIAFALEAAHAAGMVHRDLKPDNVWLVPDPRGGHVVRVLDFGIAKLRDAASPAPVTAAPLIAADAARMLTPPTSDEPSYAGSDDAQPTLARAAISPSSHLPAAGVSESSGSQPLTVSGSTLGTPAYMSPEQCRGEAVDYRSDIYSLGVLTYEALAGKRPFGGKFKELIEAHLHATPEPLDRVAGVSPRLSQAVARSLAKAPDERYPSAPAMAGSLYAAIEGPSVVLRRAAALYADRFPLFIRIALSAFATVAVPFVILLLSLALFPRRLGFAIAGAAGIIFCWALLTAMTNAAFATTIDRLRLQPLRPPTPKEIYAEVWKRVGVAPGTGALLSAFKLTFFYVRVELGAVAGAGDLAFLCAFMEGLPRAEVRERCKVLLRGAGKIYDWFKGAVFVMLIPLPAVEGCVAYVIARLAGIPHAGDVAAVVAVMMIPINTIFLNPILSTSLALLYFRARQANGEDVRLSSVISTGL